VAIVFWAPVDLVYCLNELRPATQKGCVSQVLGTYCDYRCRT